MLTLLQSGYRRKALLARAVRFIVVLTVLAMAASLTSKTVTLPDLHGSSVQAGGESVKNQKFEGSGTEWSVPVAAYVPELWPVEVARVTVVAETLVSFQFDDSLYIRPPPARA